MVATTWKVWSTPFVRPSNRQVVTSPQLLESPWVSSTTVNPVTGSPLAGPAVHDTDAVEALLEAADTPVGGAGRSLTATWTVPSTSREASLVLSPRRKDTVLVPLTPAGGVMVRVVPDTLTEEESEADGAPTTCSGSSGKGLVA